ncbi:MAG: FAD-dependent oxidoreductase [Nocardioidaceae bacterium]
MAEVAVVGAGLGGLATAARLAKLGHRVTVYERGSAPGGLLRRIRHDGFEWDATPFQTTVPAVLRDLFRKSGRPIEGYVDLELSTPARRHVFGDGTTLDLPTGSRGAQLDAVSKALGTRAGAAWTTFVDGQADVWQLLRAEVLDPPAGASRLGDRRFARALKVNQSLDRLLHKALDDERLRLVAGFPVARAGDATRDVPAFRAVGPYVERTFGVWRTPGGADLVAGLMHRMVERRVDVRFDTEVASLRVRGDRVDGLTLTDGSTLPSDIVVAAVSPQHVFGRLLDHPVSARALQLHEPSSGAIPLTGTYLGLRGTLPRMPSEVVLHGDPTLVVSTTGAAPPGAAAWTVTTIGEPLPDLLASLAGRGLDLREQVVARHDRPSNRRRLPSGARALGARAALAQPLLGVHCLGTGLLLGSSIPYVAWQAAHVAESLGKA